MRPDTFRTLLLDADGNLFPSEEPAFAASSGVVNRLMASLGAPARFDPDELRRASTGRNFRTLARELARDYGAALPEAELDSWVEEEKRVVSEHLRVVLQPDPEVAGVLTRLSRRYELAAVSSSALSRLDACFAVTGLSELLAPDHRFSAEDSLPRPTSKPDSAVYRLAAERLGLRSSEGLAVEDSASGVRSAVGAGIPTVGNVCFVREEERDERVSELLGAGAFAVVSTWAALERLLDRREDGPVLS